MAVSVELLDQADLKSLEEVRSLCLKLKLDNVPSQLLGNDCSMARLEFRLNRELKSKTKEFWLVYDEKPRNLVAIIGIKLARDQTTAVIKGDFLNSIGDLHRIYDALIYRISHLHTWDMSWNSISWIGMTQDMINRSNLLNQEEHPLLFSVEQEQYIAVSVLSMKAKLEESIGQLAWNKYWICVMGSAAVIGFSLSLYAVGWFPR